MSAEGGGQRSYQCAVDTASAAVHQVYRLGWAAWLSMRLNSNKAFAFPLKGDSWVPNGERQYNMFSAMADT